MLLDHRIPHEFVDLKGGEARADASVSMNEVKYLRRDYQGNPLYHPKLFSDL